jgi:cysteinyl-tRNA synthetase
MTLHLYNTLTRKIQEFKPIDPKEVRMYVCGPTVYARAHLGNFRPVVSFDVLYRLLSRSYNVKYIRNITDIDDKIIKASLDLSTPLSTITENATAWFHDDCRTLGSLEPSLEPRATDHIPEMIAFIEKLIEKDLAYTAQGHVLFHVPAFRAYGQLSCIRREEMIAGARVEVAPYKKDPSDFVLWKPSDENQVGWDSPWGRGRPGWHIECSAMCLKHLGVKFDIHAGGQDLIFPHHENEIAQSRGAYGLETFAQYWLHNGVLTIKGEKMSKSLGNVITLADLLRNAEGETIRFALLSTHYRQPLDLTEETLPRARLALNRLYGALENFSKSQEQEEIIDKEVKAALEDDLNTPLAITRLHSLASEIYKLSPSPKREQLQNALCTSAALLGLLQTDAQAWLQGKNSSSLSLSAQEIEEWIFKRTQARKARDFTEADRIRDFLAAQGIILLDSTQETTWRRA